MALTRTRRYGEPRTERLAGPKQPQGGPGGFA